MAGTACHKLRQIGWRTTISAGGRQSGHSVLRATVCSPDHVKPRGQHRRWSRCRTLVPAQRTWRAAHTL